MTVLQTYLVIFVAGPLAFWVLARRQADRGDFALLLAIATALSLLALTLPRWAGAAWQSWEYFGAALVAMLWLAWIFSLAFSVQALRPRLPAGRARAWAFALGAMGTTLPWFGLQLAEMVTA